MKKIISLLLTASMLFCGTVCHAEDNIKVTIGGNNIEFDVPPQIINDRTMVPMRKIFEELGAQVEWIEDSNLILAFKGSKIIAMEIDKTILSVTDVVTSESNLSVLDVAPQIVNDRTLVPIRAISESLDMNVTWDDASKTVVIE